MKVRIRHVRFVATLSAALVASLRALGESAPSTVTNTSAHAETHWAFRPVQARPIPSVRTTHWPKVPIDNFILQRLETKSLAPAPAADKRTLLRRAAYDLTGLAPTLEEVDAFVADSAPDGFAKVIDRLLASERYGERWGRYWLDVARYADTKGYVYYYEESRFVHPHQYRDWVIDAFNADLPYDRFLLLQIAADQVLGGSARTPASAAASQVSTLRWPTPVYDPAVAALGFLTLGRRFLGLAPDIIDDQIDVLMRGTQALTVGCARCHDHKFDPIPTRDYYSLYGIFQSSEERIVAIQAPPAPNQLMEFSRAKAYVTFEQGLTDRVQKLEAKFQSASEEVANRLRGRVKDYLVALLEVAQLPSDANVRPQPEDINPFNVRQWERYLARRGARPDRDPIFSPWHSFVQLSREEFATRGAALAPAFAANDDSKLNPLVARLFTNAPQSMVEVANRYGDLLLQVHLSWKSNLAASAKAKSKLERLPDPHEEAVRQVLYGKEAPVLPPVGLVTELDVHLYFDDPNRVALANLQKELEQWLIAHESVGRHAVILEDRPTPCAPVIFRRGDPLKPGETVPRQFLGVLAGPVRRPFEQGSGRLELARAIIDPSNPLTARVIVNRVWAHHFGAGLVRTLSDFGTRSDPPTHPELLDWLARRFIADGWSVKKLHRLIMLSSTYQQSSRHPPGGQPAVEQVDPENKLLSHFSRQRLDFEALRDAFLVATGELDTQKGGPAMDLSAAPYSKRRAVYGRIDRKAIPGMMRSFDFANPDVHTAERHVTAAPQQALFLFNDPFVAERCRVVANKLSPIAETDVPGRIRQLYAAILRRAPTPSELAQATEFLRETSSAKPEPAQTKKDPLLNSWEQLAQVLFFSNDFLYVD